MAAYLNESVGELAKQLTAGLVRFRKAYIDSAEALLRIVEPKLEYPYEFVVYRLTAYRPVKRRPIEPISGETLRRDLQRIILDLCDSFDLPVEAYGDRALDTEALSERFQISTKTVRRWRQRGLVARRLVFPDGRKRLAFLESSLHNFADRRKRQILRSVRFRQLSDHDRDFIIRRARRMVARTGCCLHDVSRRLARRTGRAVETIRYSIRRYDQENPQQAIFPSYAAPLDERAQEVIYRCFLQGVPVSVLARRYGRTRGSVYRAINEVRARQLVGRKIDCIYNPEFDLPGAEETILRPSPPAPAAAGIRPPRIPEDLPPYLKSLYELPLLVTAQERMLFRQYNYLKYQADQLRRRLDPECARSGELRRTERVLMQAEGVKNQIIRANLRLVVSIAKKHLNGPQSLFELISDGNLSLMKAVEKFDYSRGFKFSTYASWAIMKNFARSVPREKYLLDRYATGSEEVLELVGGMRGYDPRATSALELRESLDVVLAQLSPRERSIIVGHFGLDESLPILTLDQLSQKMGISKERVRQLERRAMEKLRTMLSPVRSDLMA